MLVQVRCRSRASESSTIQAPSLIPRRSPCLTITETESGTEGKIIGSKTIIRRGTTAPGETHVVGTTTAIQKGSEGSITTESVSLRNLFRPLLSSSFFLQGYDGQKVYDDHGGGYSKRSDQGYGGGEGYNKKRLVPSEASPHVIFLGLDPDFTESDVSFVVSSQPRILSIPFLCSFKPTLSATTAASSRSR